MTVVLPVRQAMSITVQLPVPEALFTLAALELVATLTIVAALLIVIFLIESGIDEPVQQQRAWNLWLAGRIDDAELDRRMA